MLGTFKNKKEMEKFRKKPVVIEAIQWNGQNLKEMMIWKKVDIINLLKKVINESGCKCTEETRTGTTKVECCNICGKPVEAFWLK